MLPGQHRRDHSDRRATAPAPERGAGAGVRGSMVIDIYADFVCPWCYLGLNRLARALAERPRLRALQVWHPFQLNPDLPPEGIDRSLYLAIKFGGREQARHVYAMVEEAAALDGLPLNLSRIRHMPNTTDAHRVVAFAAHRDRAEAVIRAIFTAYFVEGQDIGAPAVLAAAAARTGLSAQAVLELLRGDGERVQVLAAEETARALELHAVPCFIFNRRFALSGAQEPKTFLPLLDLSANEPAIAA